MIMRLIAHQCSVREAYLYSVLRLRGHKHVQQTEPLVFSIEVESYNGLCFLTTAFFTLSHGFTWSPHVSISVSC